MNLQAMANDGQRSYKKLLIIVVLTTTFMVYAIFQTFTRSNNASLNQSLKNFHQLGENPDICANSIFTVLPAGNLGNQIWEYMSLIATYSMYKLYLKYTLCINRQMKETLESTFESINTHWMEDCEKCLQSKPKKVISKNKPFPAIGKLPAHYNVMLEQYSARYEDIIEFGVNNIKKELRFKENLVIYVETTLSTIKRHLDLTSENVIFIGMHYRGTDYPEFLQENHGNLFKGPPDYRYYMNAMKHFITFYENVVFILVSTDNEWLAANVPSLEKNFTVVSNFTSGEPAKDLSLLAHCNHTIINYGTYGVSAAFLNKGTTFVYDIKLPLDHRGQTLAVGIAGILSNWYIET